MSESIVKYETKPMDADALLKVLVHGNLKDLTAQQKLSYIDNLCKSLDLNPMTRPFSFIEFRGKLVLYANKDATDQIRKKQGISITKIEREIIGDVLVVTAYGQDKTGRVDSEIGALPIKGLTGDDLANAMMKGVTKSKRRLTLSLAGLGILDESELDTMKEASIVEIAEDKPQIPAETKAKKASRPFDLDTLKLEILKAAAHFGGKTANGHRSEVAAALSEFFMGDEGRHEFTEWLTGKASIKEVDDAIVLSMHRWLKPVYDKEAGRYNMDEMATQELDAWVAEYATVEGDVEEPA